MNGQVGYLKIVKDKVTRKNTPFVALLVLSSPTDEKGTWMNLFDAMWFGGTKENPSDYDIRPYADRDEPTKVLYQAEESNGFVTCSFIKPFDESWEGKPIEEIPLIKTGEESKTKPPDPVDMPEGFKAIEEAFAHIRKGCDVLEAYLLGHLKG